MSEVRSKAIAACAASIVLSCAAFQPAKAADIPGAPEYYGGPVEQPYVDEDYGYQEPAPVYRPPAYVPVPPPVVYESAPPAVVVAPAPYAYYAPGYYGGPRYAYGPRYGYGRPYVAGYHRGGRGYGHGRW